MKEVKLEEAAYQFEAKMSLRQAIPLGLQHVCAMFVGNLTSKVYTQTTATNLPIKNI